MTRWIAIAVLASACGGPAGVAPTSATTTTESTARPVRVETSASASPQPVRVAPTLAGEVTEAPDVAMPPPVEAPTGP